MTGEIIIALRTRQQETQIAGCTFQLICSGKFCRNIGIANGCFGVQVVDLIFAGAVIGVSKLQITNTNLCCTVIGYMDLIDCTIAGTDLYA